MPSPACLCSLLLSQAIFCCPHHPLLTSDPTSSILPTGEQHTLPGNPQALGTRLRLPPSSDWRATGFSISPSLNRPVCDVGANLINPPWTMYSSYWFCSPHKPQYRDQMSNVRIEVFVPPGGPSVRWCPVLSKGL